MASWALILPISCALVGMTWAREIVPDFYNYQVLEVEGMDAFKSEDDFYSKIHLPLADDVESEVEIIHEDGTRGVAHFLVKPELKNKFVEGVENMNLEYKVIIEDVGAIIQSTKQLRRDLNDLKGGSTLDRYMELSEIENYLTTINKTKSSKVKVTDIGKTIEKKPIYMATISSNVRRSDKPIIFIEAGAHAREWVSVASGIGIIDKLLTNATSLAKKFEWRVVPVINPDGYQYTWDKNRLWRKNRRHLPNSKCDGVDINRNFDIAWNKEKSRKCSWAYAGEKAFSEPEAIAIRDAVMAVQPRIAAYISLHSYGQMIMHPPGVSGTSMTKEMETEMNLLTKKMKNGILKSTKQNYTYGNPRDLLYNAAGISMDWAMIKAKIPKSMTFELRDTGLAGFLLSPNQIVPTIKDLWAAIEVLMTEISNKEKKVKKNEILHAHTLKKQVQNQPPKTTFTIYSNANDAQIEDLSDTEKVSTSGTKTFYIPERYFTYVKPTTNLEGTSEPASEGESEMTSETSEGENEGNSVSTSEGESEMTSETTEGESAGTSESASEGASKAPSETTEEENEDNSESTSEGKSEMPTETNEGESAGTSESASEGASKAASETSEGENKGNSESTSEGESEMISETSEGESAGTSESASEGASEMEGETSE